MDIEKEVQTIIADVENSTTVKEGVDILIKSIGTLITKAEADPSTPGTLEEKLVANAPAFSEAVKANTAAALETPKA